MKLFCSLLVALACLPAAADPLKGIVLWPDMARDRPDLSRAVSLEFSYCRPCDVAVGTNSAGAVAYDWSGFDALLSAMAARGHQAIIRFRYVYPNEKLGGVRGATAVPAFIKSRADYHETFAANPGGDGPTWYPDWSCKALEDFTLAFYAEFAARYDADPRLAFVQAGFGHWAEYHTSGTETKLGTNFPSMEFQRRFFALLGRSFSKTPWMVSIDAAGRDGRRSPAPELAAKGAVFGLFDDSFMCKKHDVVGGKGGWNERNWAVFGADHWMSAPHGGEISYYSKGDQRNFLGPDGIYGVTWALAAAKYHMTFVIANDSPKGPFATPERFAEAARECGPSLVATKVREQPGGVQERPGETEGRPDGMIGQPGGVQERPGGMQERIGGVEVTVTNKGVAPPYHDIAVSVGGIRAPGTLKGLLPGESRVFFAAEASPDCALQLVSEKLLAPIPLPR